MADCRFGNSCKPQNQGMDPYCMGAFSRLTCMSGGPNRRQTHLVAIKYDLNQKLVVFAEMRTGSNFRGKHLKAFDGITVTGRRSPHFHRLPKSAEILGVDQGKRGR